MWLQKVFCEKFVVIWKNQANIDKNHIFFTNMNFKMLQLFLCEIHHITVRKRNIPFVNVKEMWLLGLPKCAKHFSINDL